MPALSRRTIRAASARASIARRRRRAVRLERSRRTTRAGTSPLSRRRERAALPRATRSTRRSRRSRARDDGERYFFELALLHEDMHGEALLMTLQTLGLPAPRSARRAAPRAAPRAARDVDVRRRRVRAWAAPRRARAFVFDNEKWAHRGRASSRSRSPSRAVTQGEFARFVEDDGYARRSGRRGPHGACCGRPALLEREARLARAPLRPLDAARARARRWSTCRCTRRRPIAAGRAGACRPRPNGSSPRAVARSAPGDRQAALDATGLRQIGGVWEWTSSAFAPYPGFSADPYEDYSRAVVPARTTCCAAAASPRAPRLVHDRFRNFYLPERADVFAGFRTCALERLSAVR